MGIFTTLTRCLNANLLFFFSFFPTLGRNMRVILLFLLVIITSVRIGNACAYSTGNRLWLMSNAKRLAENKKPKKIHSMEKNMAMNTAINKAKRLAENEETKKNHAMEKNMAMNMAINKAKRSAKNKETKKIHAMEKNMAMNMAKNEEYGESY